MRNRRLVVFAGAGVSTEQNELFPSTLKEDIADELRIAADSVTFQELMSRYCEQPDGRQRLLQAIRGRIDYARGFPEIYGDLTAFHRALAPIWQISSIVTTNWDDFFERECSALPLVSPADFSFWSIPGRKVFKLHGSISNPASIVATTQDYEECADRLRTGLLGSSLRHMLATQSFVFVGYSLTDPDFVQIHSALAKEMGGLQPHSYVVTLDKEAAPRFEEMGLTPIVTDAAYFAELLHDHLVELGENLPRAQVGSLGILLDEFIERHITLLDNVSPVRHPEVVHCASYQDGSFTR